ncbi:MAG: enoyl-CoA hydratase-related protein [Acidimicrobiales bacterium]|nr:enoyl-CoA hydratase-related protein [Acidimicrobiales bacterium]
MSSAGTYGPNDEIIVESHDDIRIVVLNRPEALNAADEHLHGELARIWPVLDADPGVRAIVLTGAGKAFSGGGDLDLLDRMANDHDLRNRIMAEAIDIVRAMTAVRVPIVAAVHGPAVGLGCSLATMCDLVIMEEQAYYADPHVMLGLVAADGGALTWPLLTSLLRAKEYLLLGDRMPAAEAVSLGLANRVVGEGEARTAALEIAGRLAALPPQSVQETKALLNSSLRATIDSVLSGAVATESASFDEPAFRANLERMLARRRG